MGVDEFLQGTLALIADGGKLDAVHGGGLLGEGSAATDAVNAHAKVLGLAPGHVESLPRRIRCVGPSLRRERAQPSLGVELACVAAGR